jgi:DNA-binding protein YbaB
MSVGTAMNGAVEVRLDEHGRIRSVRLDPRVTRRLGPEQLGRGVVSAHADARGRGPA